MERSLKMSKESQGRNDCQREAKDLFEKLTSFREESNRQISSIINSHSSNINNGIGDLVEEVGSLRDELDVLRKERTVLLETVDNLNGEIRHLNDKLQLLPILEDELNHDVPEAKNLEVEISEATERDNETPRISKYEDQERNTEFVAVSDGAIQEKNKRTLSNVESENHSTINGTTYADAESVAKITKDGEETDNNFSNLSLDTLVCPECQFVFSTNENLTIHMENVHPMSELFVNPDINEESIDQPKSESVANHAIKNANKFMSKCTEGRKRGKHQCEKCSFETSYRTSLARHIKTVHDKIRKIRNHVICEECGYAASDKRTFNAHRTTVHKMGDFKFQCGQCPYKSNHRGNLMKHIQDVHDKIRNHVCDECGYSASRKSNLKQHKDNVHQMGEKFKC